MILTSQFFVYVILKVKVNNVVDVMIVLRCFEFDVDNRFRVTMLMVC